MNILRPPVSVFIYGLVIGILLVVVFNSTFGKIINAPIYTDTAATTIQSIIYTDVIQYNVAYLSLSLVIIVLIGGIFYLFNLRPLQESIKKQESEIKEFQARVETNFLDVGVNLATQLTAAKEELRIEAEAIEKRMAAKLDDTANSLESKFENSLADADKKIIEIKNAAEDIEMDATWYLQYVWQAHNVPINTLDSLIEYLRLCLKYKRGVMELCLQNISKTLDKLGDGLKGDRESRLHKKLSDALQKIEGHEELRKAIGEKLKRVFA